MHESMQAETTPVVPPRPSTDTANFEKKVNGTHNNSIKSPSSPVSPVATSPVNKATLLLNNHNSQMVQVSFHSSGGANSPAASPVGNKDESVGPTISPPLLGNLSKASGQPDTDGDVRRKKFPTDRSYFIAKEMLMTERTYKKDLEVINLWFREEVTKEEEAMPEDALNSLFKLIDPLLDAHSNFLREVELRLAAWEGRTNPLHKSESQKIGDVILKGMNSLLSLYHDFLGKHLHVLEQLDLAFRKNRKFEQLYRDFEQQKICYLPITSFVLKPLQRLLHYQNLLNRLIKHYGKDHPDYADCIAAQEKLSEVVSDVPDILRTSENFVQLCELQRDIVGLDAPLVLPGRQFVRQGCLIKISPKALQQRMFFLFSDMLLYTNRGQHPSMQFKLHGQWPLSGLTVVESGSTDESSPLVAAHSFTIYGANRDDLSHILGRYCSPMISSLPPPPPDPNCSSELNNGSSLRVAAHGQEEKDKWLEDLYSTIQAARERGASNDGLHYHSLKSCSSSDEVLDKSGVSDGSSPGGPITSPNQSSTTVVTSPSTTTTSPTQRSNTTVHVCWHRNTSIGMNDQMCAVENQLSGYLLRKFKNSNGWQKLWVVFANFCLFFYKNFQDDFPLACLPLLGYYASSPSPSDNILKDYVFKLQFKNHVYFFRAESEYTFERWMEVISSATQHAGRHRLFSRKDSAINNGEDSMNG
ncbi:FERM, ARHGEF and pleckstrin domain-containing protein 1-like [Ischnura elegans]|uniref:FERM, ARHGEF and pleckstrin domain-containing protein 1-like n=1 Tax=Ischnura elegans TaxID=197161 RepID=UPI001ED894C4|nr:FERM, ARHGEF and pleckstrin domain-containing protein 1-like [Ischnura elegans]